MRIFDLMSERTSSLLFFLVTLFLSSWYVDASQNDNITSRAATVAALVEQGTFRIDTFNILTGDKALFEGHYYSEKAPLPALLVAPFHALALLLHFTHPSTATALDPGLLRLGGIVAGSVPFAVIMLLVWQRVRRSAWRIAPSTVVLLTFFGSFLFIYAGSFFGHLIGAMFVLLALRAKTLEHYVWTGVWGGCAVLCEFSLVIFPLCWIIDLGWKSYRHGSARPLLKMIAGGSPFLVFLLVYNTALFGSPFAMGYAHVVGYTSAGGGLLGAFDPGSLFGLTISMYRGLFPHMPILILGLIAAWKGRRSILDNGPMNALVPSILLFVFVALLGMWWGGWAFGPRHLTTVGVVLAYGTLPYLAERTWSRWAVPLVGLFGIVYAFGAQFTLWHGMPTGVQNPLLELVLPAVRNGQWTTMQWPTLLGVAPGVANLLFVLVFALVVVLGAWMERTRPVQDSSLPLR